MQVITHSSVKDFFLKLDSVVSVKVDKLVHRLKIYRRELHMPDAKPIGSGLWELRSRGHPAIRIIYGFYEDKAILLFAFKKQANAIRSHDLALARNRFNKFCDK